MSVSAAVVVEQYWHRVPGGTLRATSETLRALRAANQYQFVGVAARHRVQPAEPPPIPVVKHWLPRPILYEAWHRCNRPALPVAVDLIWAPAMVVPPASAPLVVTVHDLDFLHHPERLSRRGRSFFPAAWKATRERADWIVCPSEHTARDAAKAGADASKLSVVPWGVSAEAATEAEVSEVRSRWNLPEVFVLWVGTVEPRKNLARLVEAMEGLPLTLVVVGPEGWVQNDQDLLRPLGMRARRLGLVNNKDLRALYAAATVFAFPSLAEGFGLPVLEAMSQGTAVVTSQNTATEEAAGGAAVLVDPFDAASIRDAIASVFEDGELRNDLQRRGAKRAAAMTWQATAAGYADAFSQVLPIGAAR